MEVITNVSVVHSIFVAAIREKKNKSRERYGWEQSHSIRENNAKSSAKRSDREHIREEGATRRNWGRNNIHHDAGSLVGSWWFIRTIARKKWRTNKKRKSQNKTEKKNIKFCQRGRHFSATRTEYPQQQKRHYRKDTGTFFKNGLTTKVNHKKKSAFRTDE